MPGSGRYRSELDDETASLPAALAPSRSCAPTTTRPKAPSPNRRRGTVARVSLPAPRPGRRRADAPPLLLAATLPWCHLPPSPGGAQDRAVATEYRPSRGSAECGKTASGDDACRSQYLGCMAAIRASVAYDRAQERRRAVAIAQHYRAAEGLSIAHIAERLGRSPATVKAYFYDPSDDNNRPRCAHDRPR